jgi:phosphoglycolate phosphatase-like HAD superfamily hydrolase
MKRDFRAILYTLDGTPLISDEAMRNAIIAAAAVWAKGGEKPVDLEALRKATGAATDFTLCSAATAALVARFPDEQNMAGEEHQRRYELAARIYSASRDGLMTEVTAEDVALVKKLLARMYAPLVVGQACIMLETEPQ